MNGIGGSLIWRSKTVPFAFSARASAFAFAPTASAGMTGAKSAFRANVAEPGSGVGVTPGTLLHGFAHSHG